MGQRDAKYYASTDYSRLLNPIGSGCIPYLAPVAPHLDQVAPHSAQVTPNLQAPHRYTLYRQERDEGRRNKRRGQRRPIGREAGREAK